MNADNDCYIREHTFPQGWFVDGLTVPMKADAFIMLFPSDGYVNSSRSNLPLSEVDVPNAYMDI